MARSGADLIIYLVHKNLILQFLILFKRYLKRKNEKISEFKDLCKHVIYKKYGLGYEKKKQPLHEFLEKHNTKIVYLYSFKEINNFLKNF